MKLSTLIILFFCVISVNGQDLIHSRQSSYYTYIYKLTDAEAVRIYKRKNIRLADKYDYFHTLVDSFPTYGEYRENLDPGNYLKVYVLRNRLIAGITSIENIDVQVVNNNTDLCVQLYNSDGKMMDNAEVIIGSKTLLYDPVIQSYILNKSNSKGILEVHFHENTYFYDLSRQINNPWIKRTGSKILYGPPISYVWRPVKFIVSLPVDGIKALARIYPHYTISRIGNTFRNLAGKVDLLFNEYNWHYFDGLRKHKGYFVFNKPIFLPEDTVRFKAFVVDLKGKPIKGELSVVLEKQDAKRLRLGKIQPNHEGSYSFQFVLKDTIKLDLDRNYRVFLEQRPRKVVSSGNFRYEDYELKSSLLSLRADETTQIKGKEFKIHIRGTDENDLNILDGRLEIIAKSGEVKKYLNTHIFIPDTLLFLKKPLEQTGETVIMIPDSLFPAANFKYYLEVNLYRSDNEKVVKSLTVDYYNKLDDISYDLAEDSVRFLYKLNGSPVKLKASISGGDNFGNLIGKKDVSLPYSDKINPYYKFYYVETDAVKKRIEMPEERSLIDCSSGIEGDTVKILVDNPRKLQFTYFIYEANRLLKKGYGTELNYQGKADQRKKYYLSLNFLWAGKMVNQTYQVFENENNLNISVNQPGLIYPGQKVEIEINVTDNSGIPVSGVDLTAFSLTKKFGYIPPDLPEFQDKKRQKDLINTFRINKPEVNNISTKLDFKRWEDIATLDTIEYFNFIYPDDGIYYYYYKPFDGVTQFAPYIVKNGALQTIHVISADDRPVYFSWTGNNQPYTFKLDSGYHYLRLRTREKEYFIDSVYFRHGMKLIISIDEIDNPRLYSYKKIRPDLSKAEKNTLHQYLFPFRNNFGEQFVYLKQNDRITLLNSPSVRGESFSPSYNYYQYYKKNAGVAGPAYPGQVEINVAGNNGYKFMNEADFEYEFLPGIIKMRTTDRKKMLPGYLYGNPVERLSDNPLTEKRIMDDYNNYLFEKKYLLARFNIPDNTARGNGKLVLEYDSLFLKTGIVPIYLVLIRDNNRINSYVYPGNIGQVHNLRKGTYSVFMVFYGDKYCRYDSVEIKPDGRNYQYLPIPKSLKQDDFFPEISEIIEHQLYGGKLQPDQKYFESLKQILSKYNQYRYYGEGKVIQGVVKDTEGEPLPGVTVMVKGTEYGTITDLNGHYSINVPLDNDVLVFSFIGFEPVERRVYSEINDISMSPSVMHLDEVVVTGYGTTRKSNLVSAQAVVTSSLAGRVSGVQIQNNSGRALLSIRGVSNVNRENPPLFVIDGMPYLGDMDDLDPALFQNIEIIKDESLIGIYGARAANGVVLISTTGMKLTGSKVASLLKGADYDMSFMQEVSKQNSIRSNFSDYGYWKPDLITDKNGKASFGIRFPDDVTRWSTYVLAMNSKKQSGQTGGSIKSYKPLMAQLFVPRFLIEGDSVNLIGKVLNYTPDTVNITTSMELNDRLIDRKNINCINSVVDTIPAEALSADTIRAKYYFQKSDGYLDGEIRKLPVFKRGIESTKGGFFVLNGDTSVIITPDKIPGISTIYAQADVLDVIKDEIMRLFVYSYDCNEQMASKLKALIAEETISRFQKKIFLRKTQIIRLINALEKNQNDEGLWGWWDKSETSLWITVHVLEALEQAGGNGYKITLNQKAIAENSIWRLDSERDNSLKLQFLCLLSLLDSKINIKEYLTGLNENSFKSLTDKFRFIELKQKSGMNYSPDSVLRYEGRTLFGNIYFGEVKSEPSLLENDIQITLNAYRILSKDTLLSRKYLSGIRNFFLESKRLGRWQNTYETARIIETILPDLIRESSGRIGKPVLDLSGAINKKVDEFPYTINFNSENSINVSKTGTYPVYLTSYQRFWKSDPSTDSTYFVIKSAFEDNNLIMAAGKSEKLIVNLKVRKDAQYTMIEIPIPGGCSYESKENYYSGAVHTEFFKDHVAIFYDNLKSGEYEFKVDLLPRYTGRYTINPAKVELMYFPLFHSNNEVKQVFIK